MVATPSSSSTLGWGTEEEMSEHGVPEEAVPEDHLACLARERALERLPAYYLDNIC